MHNVEPNSEAPTVKIDLIELAENGVPRMTRSWCATLAECASLCLSLNGHRKETMLSLVGDFRRMVAIRPLNVSDVVTRTHNDLEVAAEMGAYGVAFLLIQVLTPLTVIERARKKTGFDYWLGDKDDELMQRKARLEVSGLHKQSEQAFRRRIKIKIEQTKVSDSLNLPAWVIVVHFRHPKAHVEERKDSTNEPTTS
jgi:hypothetical protein